jgi:hypothetical protein
MMVAVRSLAAAVQVTQDVQVEPAVAVLLGVLQYVAHSVQQVEPVRPTVVVD